MKPLRLAAAVIALSACGKGETPPSEPGPAPVPAARRLPPPPADEWGKLTLTTLPSATGTDAIAPGPLVVASATAIVVDGRALASVTGGRVDPAVIDPASDRVVPLGPWADAATKTLTPDGLVRIAPDPSLSAVALMQVLTGVRGRTGFALIVRVPDSVRALPVRVRANPSPAAIAIAHDDDRTAAQVIEAIVAARGDAAPVELTWALKTLAQERKEREARKEREERQALAVQMSTAEAMRFADILAASDDQPLAGDMARTRPGADLGRQLDEVREVGGAVATGGGMARAGSRGGGDPRVGIAGGPGIGDSGPPSGPAGRISMAGGVESDDTSLTLALVKQKIGSAYISGLKRCYKQALAKDPALHGTLALRLSVGENGRVTDGRATGPDATLTECVDGMLTSWRFAAPTDSNGEPTTASFQVELQLVPE